jgi:hypothetical protein
MLIITCYLETFFRHFAVCECKVTHFPSVTQIFWGKSDSAMHKMGVIVQKIGVFECVSYNKFANLIENLHF